jgi:hypothetical protein
MPPDPMTTFQDLGFQTTNWDFPPTSTSKSWQASFSRLTTSFPSGTSPHNSASAPTGKRTHVKADMLARLLPVLYANISYKGSHNNIMFKHNADDALQLKYNEHDVHLGFIHPGRKEKSAMASDNPSTKRVSAHQ